ncbi:uncharacterized protein AMSG_08932 [Thecamonas trahens ATCC 50062]|uniref:ER membrane protein complex subunit 1 n=1 Tax=Thecamonas trahens ATCC 50062 TaxID=461836 RepID=A0A0L0DM74_THETB|nr:hypothetical protein AMSG_08932 [Thecamonas trahens ATCC 50062]KNC53424.1 hypothetical protein AMSG_08932 [Thecamonas trahens ATCC 50062]|eukprot:XP_013754461.1 hypothetical protein AMSG_08932 [Thecamonas trahens ATCC 50062]
MVDAVKGKVLARRDVLGLDPLSKVVLACAADASACAVFAASADGGLAGASFALGAGTSMPAGSTTLRPLAGSVAPVESLHVSGSGDVLAVGGDGTLAALSCSSGKASSCAARSIALDAPLALPATVSPSPVAKASLRHGLFAVVDSAGAALVVAAKDATALPGNTAAAGVGLAKDGTVYVAAASSDPVSGALTLAVYDTHGLPLANFALDAPQLAASAAGLPRFVSPLVYATKSGSVSLRLMVTTTGGTVAIVKASLNSAKPPTLAWLRHEGLASVVDSAFCELPAPAGSADEEAELHSALGIGGGASPGPLPLVSQALARLSYQAARVVPGLVHAAEQAVDAIGAVFGRDPTALPPTSSDGTLAADLFGFNKAIVLAVFANADAIAVLPVPGAPLDVLVVASSASTQSSRAVRLVAATGAIVAAVDLPFAATTVVDAAGTPASPALAAALGRPLDGVVLVIDAAGAPHLVAAAPSLAELAVPGLAASLADHVYMHKITADAVVGLGYDKASGELVKTWAVAVPQGASVAAVATGLAGGAVASPAVVLPDETVLYRYLNPHLVAFAVASPATSTLRIVAVDGVSGSTVVDVRIAYAAPPTALAIVDNALVYSYYNTRDARFELGVTDMFEPEYVDHSSYNATLEPVALPPPALASAAFLSPTPFVAMGASATALGITGKDVLLYAPHRGVYALSRRLLDGRRLAPPAQPAPGTVAYEYSLPLGLTQLLSHARQVEGITTIVAAPCELESHSLVLAYGSPDVFFTRVAPSGEFDLLGDAFQYGGLMLTMVALPLGMFVLKSLVERKDLAAKW